MAMLFVCLREQIAAILNDLLTSECGELSDVGFLFRQAQLGLEPEVRLPFAHQPIFPQPVENGMGPDAFVAKGPVRQSSHGQAGVAVCRHIGITGWVAGTDIVRGGGVYGSPPIHHRGWAEQSSGASAECPVPKSTPS